MKKSSKTAGYLDLDQAFKFSHQEVVALREADRDHRPLTLEQYLDFCSQFPDATYEQLKNRPGPRGKRFTL